MPVCSSDGMESKQPAPRPPQLLILLQSRRLPSCFTICIDSAKVASFAAKVKGPNKSKHVIVDEDRNLVGRAIIAKRQSQRGVGELQIAPKKEIQM